VIMIGVCIWALRRGSKPYAFIFSALVIATMLNIVYSPHYPWYFLWLLPFVTIVPWRPAFYLVAASAFLFGTNLGTPGEPMYRLNILLYSGFAFMLAYDLVARQSLRFNLRIVSSRKPRPEALVGPTVDVRNS